MQLLRFVFEAAFRSGLGLAAEGGDRDGQVWLRDVEVCTDLQAACARASCWGGFSVSSDSPCASHLSECGLVRGDAECVTGCMPRDLLPAGSGRTCVRELLLDMVGEAVVVLCSAQSAGTRWRELPLY